MSMTFEQVRTEIQRFEQRCETARMAGGISCEAIMDGVAKVPDGWVYDMWTDYYVPANLFMNEAGILQ